MGIKKKRFSWTVLQLESNSITPLVCSVGNLSIDKTTKKKKTHSLLFFHGTQEKKNSPPKSRPSRVVYYLNFFIPVQ